MLVDTLRFSARLALLSGLSFVLFTCAEPTKTGPLETCFYHWQTRLDPGPTARKLLSSYASRRLYVKAFDVSWQDGRAAPTALLEVADTAGLPRLIPVVFIENAVFLQHAAAEIPGLAKDIVQLAERLLPGDFPELQIDCDWTARTQVPYFDFLKALKELRPDLEITCTIRLHQYRDRNSQGIPPLNRATLMAYNTGNLNDWETENSILDSNIIKVYLKGSPEYPLDLDLAVAVYDWAAVYRQGKLAYLINEPDLTELADTSRFLPLTPLRYEVSISTYLDGLYLYRGDLIRREQVSPGQLNQQQALLQRLVSPFPGQRLMIYRLGSRLWE